MVRIQSHEGDTNTLYSRTKADIRQSERLEKALEAASATIGTSIRNQPPPPYHCQICIQAFLPAPLVAEEETFHDIIMMAKIRAILTLPPTELLPGPFRFELTTEAASHNRQILKQHQFQVQQCIESYPNTIIRPGSEFRDPHIIEAVMGAHSNWKLVRHYWKKEPRCTTTSMCQMRNDKKRTRP
jgi:hypothetical protein